ncbi:MAG: SIR2 family protein [Syntrophomonadaceae bacterium]|nr:SIR2 family protein [Syntrophomonadaceae bacterium]
MADIISDLLNRLQERRLIPFIGAGFSESCGCPSAGSLIYKLARHFQTDNVLEAAGEVDLLRWAEYLKIINAGHIDEVLEQIHQLLNYESIDIAQSKPHLLLARMGAPIVYTTNFDHLIEQGYNHLHIPCQIVVTTEDIIAAAGSNCPQIVKFHGSLGQKDSVVLTESDYYERLEFVTPIDIKLRADALGKSLLFMGYSFSDFNVRYLWFKLRKMMQGIKDTRIPQSYILLFRPDPITATLLENTGIIPIDLSQYDGSNKTEKLCSFLELLI